ncbi:MAG: glycoside hydrolase family 32 protein [Ferruginibacter sp.]
MCLKNILIAGLLFSSAAIGQNKLYTEQYRPQFHFSPATNWCNDPNGLVYHNGIYHLFYQHNPFGNQWGHMTWAHATSQDLIHWKHQPIAIPEENGIMIFSGTCIVDKNNTSGFGKDGKTPLVAVYTGHIENVNQSQHIAYSLDDGNTWTKYSGNPVLDLHKKDFRDPKIFWYEQQKYWVMALMFPVEHQVHFYSSPNLKEWKHLGYFGPAGDTSGVWECPDLTQVPVEGMPGKKKWLLQMSMNGSMQYFVGEFDGANFSNENSPAAILRPDDGPDYYAAICYNQLPAAEQPVSIGWVNNWNYANDIPVTPWKGAMSLPRKLSVKKENGHWILLQQPISESAQMREKKWTPQPMTISGEKVLPFRGTQFEMTVTLIPGKGNTVCGVKICTGNNEWFEAGYDAVRQVFYTDRSHCSNNGFSKKFGEMKRFEKKVPLKNNRLQLHIFADNSIAEIFVNNGEHVMTTQFFTQQGNNGLVFFSNNGHTAFRDITIWKMRSVWQGIFN